MSRIRIPDDAPYRTISGQTGTDAYRYELAQLANRRRELESDERRLAFIIARETVVPSAEPCPVVGLAVHGPAVGERDMDAQHRTLSVLEIDSMSDLVKAGYSRCVAAWHVQEVRRDGAMLVRQPTPFGGRLAVIAPDGRGPFFGYGEGR